MTVVWIHVPIVKSEVPRVSKLLNTVGSRNPGFMGVPYVPLFLCCWGMAPKGLWDLVPPQPSPVQDGDVVSALTVATSARLCSPLQS